MATENTENLSIVDNKNTDSSDDFSSEIQETVVSEGSKKGADERADEDKVIGGKKDKGKKKKKKIGSRRGFETMIRSCYRTQLEMTGLSDNKANILISINGLMLTVIVASGGLIKELDLYKLIPASCFLLTCLVSLTYAVLSVRPRVGKFNISADDIRNDRASILFFGSLDNLSPNEHAELMTDLLQDQDRVYNHMMSHLYGIGKGISNKFRLLKHSYDTFMCGIITSVILFLVLSIIKTSTKTETNASPMMEQDSNVSKTIELTADQRYQQFKKIYEPSAIVQISKGRMLVVEDEDSQPLDILKTNKDGKSFLEITLSPKDLFEKGSEHNDFRLLDDLEGLDVDNQGFVYAITSHARGKKGRKPNREKLVRFKIEGNRIINPLVYKDLKNRLTDKFPALKTAAAVADVKNNNGFNIEGLSFDEKKDRLLIGFRGPVIESMAMVVALENIYEVFEQGDELLVSDEVMLLDLGGDGIRGMNYDSRLKGYFILSGPVKKIEAPFYLWFWNGDSSYAPQRVEVPGIKDFERAEGITQVNRNGEEMIMIVFDDGDAEKKQPARYLFLSYDELRIALPKLK